MVCVGEFYKDFYIYFRFVILGKIFGWNMDFEKLDLWEKFRFFEKFLGFVFKGVVGVMFVGGSGEKKFFFFVFMGCCFCLFIEL